MSAKQLILAALCLTLSPQLSQAHGGPRWSIGVNLGGPGYYGGHGYYGRPWHPGYYYPRPVYFAPPPLVLQPAPVVYAAPAVVQVPVAAPVQQVQPVPVQPTAVIQANHAGGAGRAEALLQQLGSAQETTRREAALELGRMKATQAIDPLTAALGSDASPAVRDAAARALGLIGSQRGLNALIRAAQADDDRDVRHSAQFAVEVIRTNLRN